MMYIVYIASISGIKSKKSFIGPFNSFKEGCDYAENVKNDIEQKYNVRYYTPCDGWYCADFNTNYSKYANLPHEIYVSKIISPENKELVK